ncbi:hypothetical protein F2Q69_00053484 [Brassica cretica]|uniref:Uncharacterized protein n=1 Tax=Brassica cretica TaxID=69181 RepID=A0A8S9MZC2_BRACR|nr:hypothetical protein F2Q69_00053484 [Brassica cretica]
MDSARPPDRSSSPLGLKDDRKAVGEGGTQQKVDRVHIDSKSSKGVSHRLNVEIETDVEKVEENKENGKEQKESNVEEVITGDLVKEAEEGSNTSKWSLVLPAKIGRFIVDLVQEEMEV